MKRKISLLLAAAVLILSGCSNEISKPGEAAQDVAMGRYLEETIELPKEFSNATLNLLKNTKPSFLKMTDGSYQIDYRKYAVYSKNEGEIWTWESEDGVNQFMDKNYLISMQKSASGEYFAVYMKNDSSEEEFAVNYLYIDETGKENVLDIKLPEEGTWISNSLFLDDGTLIVSDRKGNIYECGKADGSIKELVPSRTGGGYYLTATAKYIIAADSKGVVFYNRKTKEITEDVLLNEFLLTEELLVKPDLISYPFLMVEGDHEDSLYIACKSGIYNRIIGGNVVEKVIDGRLTSLGDLTKGLCGMLRNANGDFFILYTNGNLMKYTYREDIPTVPQVELKVFSMEENPTVSQAVNLFQKENQDIYVKYEIGLNEESGMDVNDIIKNINMEWIAGDGADIYILDGLERKNYERKGMLLDLSDILKNSKEELLTNITNAFETEGRIFAVPVRYEIPLIFGEKNDIANVSDLRSMTEKYESLQNAGIQKRLTGAVTEKEFIRLFANAEANKWLDEEGLLNEKEIENFLFDVKKIYDMDMKLYREEDEVRLHEWAHSQVGTEEEAVEKYITNLTNAAIGYLSGIQHVFYGNLADDNFPYGLLDAIKSENSDTEYKLYGKGDERKYLPKSIVGINARSHNKEEATAFLETLLGEELQKNSLGDGLSVNEESYQRESNSNESSALFTNDETGNKVNVSFTSTTKKQRQYLYNMAKELNTPVEADRILLDIMLELAPAAINGEKEVSNVVEEIKNRMQIRLAE